MTTIQIKDETLEVLKLLKNSEDGKSYDEVVYELVTDKLKDSYGYTKDGYLGEGTVVRDGDVDLVIKAVKDGKIIFNDGSYVLNGSRAAWGLVKVADSVKSYDGGRVDG